MRDLVHPEIMIEGIGVNHDEGKTFAGDFVINLKSVGGTVHEFPIAGFKTFKPFNAALGSPFFGVFDDLNDLNVLNGLNKFNSAFVAALV